MQGSFTIMQFNIKVENDYMPSFRTTKVAGIFDIEPKEKMTKCWDVNLPIEDIKWQIGCIIGSSGSGKTTIAKKIFKDSYHNGYLWDGNSIVDNFDEKLDIKTITSMLSHVGFSSPPNWLLPYHALSNGQKFRVEMARALLENKDIIVFDEFTSVVDRNVAKIGSAAISKTIKKSNKKFIAVSCHYDILEWLEPDWIFDVDKNEFSRRSLRRPEIELSIYKCDKTEQQKIWQVFKQHHYLSANLSQRSTVFYALINGEFCGFTSYITMPYVNGLMYREHRTVTLPDFQGIGIGNKLSEFLGDYVKKHFNKCLYSLTSHPAMIFYRNKSNKWQTTRQPGILRPQTTNSNLKKASIKGLRKSGSHNRLTASFKYLGN